jgi:hypothetical protein
MENYTKLCNESDYNVEVRLCIGNIKLLNSFNFINYELVKKLIQICSKDNIVHYD